MTAKRISEDKINRIKVVLAEKNMSQKDLAKELGFSEITVNSFVQNIHQPKLKDLKRIAALLNVNIKDLLYDSPVK